jgi:hypothetical protein
VKSSPDGPTSRARLRLHEVVVGHVQGEQPDTHGEQLALAPHQRT